MKVRIESDGSSQGTRVFDLTTGEDITAGICDIVWEHGVRQPPRVTLQVLAYNYAVHTKVETDVAAFIIADPDGTKREYRLVDHSRDRASAVQHAQHILPPMDGWAVRSVEGGGDEFTVTVRRELPDAIARGDHLGSPWAGGDPPPVTQPEEPHANL